MVTKARHSHAPGWVTAYVIVHPDDFALKLNLCAEAVATYKSRLKQKVKRLLDSQAVVIVLNLAVGDEDLPLFLRHFQGHAKIHVVPSLKNDGVERQVQRLRRLLDELEGIKHIIFTGGWKNACLKHTVNHIIAAESRVRMIESMTAPISTKVLLGNQTRLMQVEIDQEFVF